MMSLHMKQESTVVLLVVGRRVVVLLTTQDTRVDHHDWKTTWKVKTKMSPTMKVVIAPMIIGVGATGTKAVVTSDTTDAAAMVVDVVDGKNRTREDLSEEDTEVVTVVEEEMDFVVVVVIEVVMVMGQGADEETTEVEDEVAIKRKHYTIF
jgi:hypothetical protein